MKKLVFAAALVLVFVFVAGCSASSGNPANTVNGEDEPGDISSSVPPEDSAAAPKAPAQDGTQKPQEENAYVVPEKLDFAPIFDAATGKEIGKAYKGFALNINSVRGERAYFTIWVNEMKKPDEVSPREFFIPLEHLEKTYKEPFFIIEIISLDMIVLNAGAPMYNEKGQEIAVFGEDIGPMQFIQKTGEGYQMVIADNLVYIRESDAKFIKYNM